MQMCIRDRVYGMPKAIAEAGAADEIVPLTEIAQAIICLLYTSQWYII